MLFHLEFAKNTLLSYFFFFFLIIDLYFLTPSVITKNFNSTAELVTPTKISTREAKSEMETHPVTAETKIKYVGVQ